jgi:capsular exopolysaccharide synthesis family protein
LLAYTSADPALDADLKLAAPAPDRNEGALGPYLRAVAAHRLLVFSTTLLAVLGAVAWLALRSPDYEATAELLVTPLPQDDRSFFGLDLFRDSGDPTRTVQTAATVLRTPEAAEEAARKLGGDFTRSRVLESVEVEPRGQSSVLAVRGRDPDPETAARIADEYAAGILEVRRRRLSDQVDKRIELLEARDRGLNESSRNDELKADIAEQLNALESIRGGDDPTLSLSQTAGVPGSPVGAPPWLIAALALLAGFTLGSGAALLMELLGRRLRDEDEIVRLYPLPILARIPNAARQMRKIADASPLALPPAVREAFRTLRVQLDQRTEAQGTIMITSASTGDGKTTSAVNLAVALVGAGHQVILIDFDLRKPDVGRALGVSPTRGLVSLLASDTRLSDLIVKAPPLPPLGVVPAGTEGDAFLLEALSKRLPEILAEARALADYVVLDTPPLGEVSDALRLAGHVDDIVVVARPGQTNRASFELMRDLLGRSGRVPAGLVLIGKSSGAPSSYYTYGMPQRDPVAARLPFARSS